MRPVVGLSNLPPTYRILKKKSHALYNRDINVDFFCVFTGKNHVHEHKSKK